ncbi:TonB family protein [Chitinophaga dinghuensis]|uniref:TonB family protein n=1 Tax=Chitinophaga dinghuensis TaxID=1539050 RepID=A0A327WCF1_9BACT|nr:M56 family metallopeptidase [Chitinophaga dinghuensis]RAJ87808.1 TonB family protein [Chitinophaga dinghuensis]
MKILTYFLQVICSSGILYGYYLLALRNKRFHEWNRYYLLLLPIVSLLVPLLKIPLESTDTSASFVYAYTYTAVTIREGLSSRPTFSYQYLLTILYWIIAALLLLRLLVSCWRIIQLAKRLPQEPVQDYILVALDQPTSPFSFFSWIFWHYDTPMYDPQGKRMLQHEMVHVRQYHSIDKIWMSIISAICWFNPVFYLTQKELALVHEFIADKKAAGKEISGYAEAILQSAFQSRQFAITNDFFYPPIKRRILMLTQIQKDRFSYLRRVMILPVAGIIFCSFAFVAAAKQTSMPVAAGMNATGQSSDPEKQAAYPGGQIPMEEFIINNLRYPQTAIDHRISGTVMIHFTVAANGKITNAHTLAGKQQISKEMDEEALRVVNSMPNWQPAKENHKKVASEVVLPVTFRLPCKPSDVLTFVEKPPQFPDNDIVGYLIKNLKYPKEAKEKHIKGTVFLLFVVEADGRIRDVQPMGKSLGYGLEEEAIRVVNAMPLWIPGTHQGKKVAVQYALPVRFEPNR